MPIKSPADSRLAKKIRTALEKSNLSNFQIAQRLGIHRSTVGRFLRGEINTVSLDTLEKILDFLKWDIGPKQVEKKSFSLFRS